MGHRMIDLLCHECSPSPRVRSIRVSAAITDAGALSLHYRVSAEREGLSLPEHAAPRRVEGLWRHTCFEAFVMGEDAPAYREFNFSPSGAWQAYGFQAYRQGGPRPDARPPGIARDVHADLGWNVTLPASELPPGPRLRLGLSAVLESTEGELSYWALRHPPGQPDFHHPDCFVLELARP